jgi:biofilm PGA synthesis N-glycosyltransferase PgaC
MPLYAYIGYPLVLLGLGVLIRRPVKKRPIQPYLSLLIPARNEARVIERKIRNSLALDYPSDRIEIVIVSDGSTDETVAIARRFQHGGRVRLVAFPKNRGKTAVLNAVVPELRGDIVVFSDASAVLAPDSVRRLVENFADVSVGAASGLYQVVRPAEVSIGASENFYWKYETFLKTRESQLASTLGGHGQLHAIRKELYPFPPAETINDDYVIPLSVVSRGFRAVYEPTALVYEEAREMTGFARRIRIMTGNLQQLRYLPFNPCRCSSSYRTKWCGWWLHSRCWRPWLSISACSARQLIPPCFGPSWPSIHSLLADLRDGFGPGRSACHSTSVWSILRLFLAFTTL